jgi:hypothetical protein
MKKAMALLFIVADAERLLKKLVAVFTHQLNTKAITTIENVKNA